MKVVDFKGFKHTAIYIAVCNCRNEIKLLCLARRPPRGKYRWIDLAVGGYATWYNEVDNMEDALMLMQKSDKCVSIVQFDNDIDLAANLHKLIEVNQESKKEA